MKVDIYNSDFVYLNTRYLDEVIEHDVPNVSEQERDRIYDEAARELQNPGRYWLSARIYLVPASH